MKSVYLGEGWQEAPLKVWSVSDPENDVHWAIPDAEIQWKNPILQC